VQAYERAHGVWKESDVSCYRNDEKIFANLLYVMVLTWKVVLPQDGPGLPARKASGYSISKERVVKRSINIHAVSALHVSFRKWMKRGRDTWSYAQERPSQVLYGVGALDGEVE
jgi:hypothetical protein